MFTSEEMTDVVQSMNNAIQQILSNSIADTRTKISLFISNVVLRWPMATIVSAQGLEGVVGEVFGDATHRDFVLNLQYHFMSYWGQYDRYSELCKLLALSASQPKLLKGSGCLIPRELTDRLSDPVDVEKVLLDNPWLVVTMLLPLSVSLDIDGEKVSLKSKA